MNTDAHLVKLQGNILTFAKATLGTVDGPRSRISFSADVVQDRPRRKELIGRCIFHALISFQMVPFVPLII